MSFFDTLINGEQGAFKHESMTPLQKVTLRTVVIGLLWYGVAAIEGMMMRAHHVQPLPMLNDSHFFSIMTAHPIVAIFGSTYMVVFGAFIFLVPFLMKKPVYSIKIANWTWILIAVGTLFSWTACFLYQYAPLYTLYWPLPVDMGQFQPIGGFLFILGVALIMVGTLFFIFNIYATVLYTEPGHKKRPIKPLLISGFGIDGLLNLINKVRGKEPYSKEPAVSLPVVAIFRGTVDTLLDAFVILSCGVLILVYIIFHMAGSPLDPAAIDALLYKNWFWWGLDLIADGLVLIYVAGAWYLLAMLITGKDLFMQNVARAALLIELIVSWTVWSHHLLSDQGQPNIMKITSGEMVTAFELVTMGIAVFITLMTLWRARPLKWTNELKFLLGGMLGFALAVPAGIMQADLGLNRVLHNTQWIIGPHVHVAVLVGLTMTLYSVIYVLFPILTNGGKLFSQKMASFHFWAHLIGGIGMGAFMGMAGINGMLRRTLYHNGEFNTLMILAAAFGSLLLLSWVVFIVNIVLSVGLRGLIGIYLPSKVKGNDALPAEA